MATDIALQEGDLLALEDVRHAGTGTSVRRGMFLSEPYDYRNGRPALFVDEAHNPLSYRRWKRLLANAATASGV